MHRITYKCFFSRERSSSYLALFVIAVVLTPALALDVPKQHMINKKHVTNSRTLWFR